MRGSSEQNLKSAALCAMQRVRKPDFCSSGYQVMYEYEKKVYSKLVNLEEIYKEAKSFELWNVLHNYAECNKNVIWQKESMRDN